MNALVNKAAIPNPALEPFGVLVGEWKTTGSHPAFPDVTFGGKTSFKWIEGGAFLMMYSEVYHDQFPVGMALFGSDDALGKYYMLYFDERKVSRKNDVQIDGNLLSWERIAPKFSQRYSFTISEDRNTIVSKGELSTDDETWGKDLDLIYTRVG